MTDSLFTPLSLGAIELPHRIAMAPMTRSRAKYRQAVHAIIQSTHGQTQVQIMTAFAYSTPSLYVRF